MELSIVHGNMSPLVINPLDIFSFLSHGHDTYWDPLALEDYLAFSMDVILVTLELIHLELLGKHHVTTSRRVGEMGLKCSGWGTDSLSG